MKIIDAYKWSTHKPLLVSIVDIIKLKFILELGMGIHSTPIFLNSGCKDIIFIDNDDEWLKHLKKNFRFNDGHEVIFHDLGSAINIATFLRQLSSEEKLQIVKYYKKLSLKISNKIGTPKMLFVDNFTCCRTIAINTLYKNFDVIVYHDCEPRGIPWYEYYFEENLKKDFSHYVLKVYDLLSMPRAWTGCFISNKLDIGLRLEDNIKQHIFKYRNRKEVGVNVTKMYLEKLY